jgi:hypothetical protein
LNITDNNPDRRNLTLISLVTLTYFLADGDIAGEGIKIPFVNIVLNDSSSALLIFLTIFCWFNFRYWLTFKSTPFSDDQRAEGYERSPKWQHALQSALNKGKVPKKLIDKLPATVEFEIKLDKKFASMKRDERVDGKYRYAIEITGTTLNVVHVSSMKSRSLQEVIGWQKTPLIFLLTLSSFWRHPFLSLWYIPWLLSVSALFLLAIELI